MALLPFNFEILLAGVLFLILLLKIGKRRDINDAAVLLPPGPSKLPLIGSMHHLIGPLPHHTLRDLAKKYGDLMHIQLGEVSAVVISSTEFAREAMLTNQANFATRASVLAAEIMTYNCTGIAFAPYGEYWRQLKKLCTLELLSAKRVKSFLPIRKEESAKLMHRIASRKGSPVNLSKEADSSIHGITAIAAFGKTCKEHEQFIHTAKGFTLYLAGFNIADVYPSAKWLHYVTGVRTKLMKLRRQGDRIMETLIDQHKMKKASQEGKDDEAEAEDLVDVLLRYQHPNENNIHLTTDNIKAIILEVFTGGGDTAATVVEWAMSEMMKNPSVMTKAQTEVRHVFDKMGGKVDETNISELHYLKLVVKETMRLHPPIPLLARESTQACKMGGYDIPMKTKVIINAWAMGRDPKYWTDPERFCPERFSRSSMDYRGTNLEFIPFGAGRRICPGIKFGVSEVEIVLALLLYHFDWKIPEGVKPEELDMTESFGIVARRKHDLELIPSVVRPLA